MPHSQVYNTAKALFPADQFNAVGWPNEDFDVPSATDRNARWCKVEVESDAFEPIEVGNGWWQESGAFHFNIFTVAGTGLGISNSLAELVTQVFAVASGLDSDDNAVSLTFNRMSMGFSGSATSDGSWWGTTVTVEYVFQINLRED